MEGIGDVGPALDAAEEGESSHEKRIAVALIGLESLLLAAVGVMIIGTTLDQQAAQERASHYLSEAFATGQGSNSVVALNDITDAELRRLGGSIVGLSYGPDALQVLARYERQAFLDPHRADGEGHAAGDREGSIADVGTHGAIRRSGRVRTTARELRTSRW